MGTRSLTKVFDTDWGKRTQLVNIYRQMDGHPSGHGADIAKFIDGMKITNGISGDPTKTANGAGCFAAQLIGTLKGGKVGDIYIQSPDAEDEQFVYQLEVGAEKGIHVIVRHGGGGLIFRGTGPEFVKWIAAEKAAA